MHKYIALYAIRSKKYILYLIIVIASSFMTYKFIPLAFFTFVFMDDIIDINGFFGMDIRSLLSLISREELKR